MQTNINKKDIELSLLNVQELDCETGSRLQTQKIQEKKQLKHKKTAFAGVFAGSFAVAGYTSSGAYLSNQNDLGAIINALVGHVIAKCSVAMLSQKYELTNKQTDYNFFTKLITDACASTLAALPAGHAQHLILAVAKECKLSPEINIAIKSSALMSSYIFSYLAVLEKTMKPMLETKCIQSIENSQCVNRVKHIPNPNLKMISEIIANVLAGYCSAKVDGILQSINQNENVLERSARYAFMGFVFSTTQTIAQGVINKMYNSLCNAK